jgi:glycosyltransferase involved in cell wall biosynthesis
LKLAVLIPALRPGPPLVDLVRELARSPVERIVVVDDGSGPEYRDRFAECEQLPRVEVLQHAVNLGKGAALKTGINHILCAYPDLAGIVTADADGQHHAEDVLRVARRLILQPNSLVLGSREFGPQTPWRNRLGNVLTRGLVRLLIGHTLKDTQTGLRGMPRSLTPHLLGISSSGFEFELDMLIAAKHRGCAVVEEDIRGIYPPAGRSSHFNPLFDSLRIYFVLLRFSALSLATAAGDNLVFFVSYAASGSVVQSQVVGRAAAVLFNYGAARRAVFLSRERHRILLPRYLLLVLASGAASYTLIQALHSGLAFPVMAAKITAESLLFIANFAIQRDFVFQRQEPSTATDWDRYYASTPLTARLTRRYTAALLVRVLRRFAGQDPGSVVELGGGNSCFFERILREVRPGAYHVVDTSEHGIELLRRRLPGYPQLRLHLQSVTSLALEADADAVFSVGLIEHFDRDGLRRAIGAHFQPLKPGAHAIISFPTPTWLYRAARSVCEALGVWRFPDERPLRPDEVRALVAGQGEVVFEKTLWPLIFTQHLMVVRKSGAGQAASVA